MRHLFVLLAVSLFLAGCASQGPVSGWVTDPAKETQTAQLGKPFVDFNYVDDKGKERPLHAELGDFTVLTFTRCDSNMHKPAAEWLQKLVDGNQSTKNVRLVGIDVHWSPAGCSANDGCHIVGAKRNLGTLCDATGAVHRVYGAAQQDWIYVIGPDRRIVFSGQAQDSAKLGRELKERIKALSNERTDAELAEDHG